MTAAKQDSVGRQFRFARLWVAVLFCYGLGWGLAKLLTWLSTDHQGPQWQLAFLGATGVSTAIALALILARPKPHTFPARSYVTLLEYALVASMLAVTLILLRHAGWQLSTQPPQGLLAVAWGIGWVAAWLGPELIAIVVLVLAHWFGLQWYLDYRQYCWQWLQDRSQSQLSQRFAEALAKASALSSKDVLYASRKLSWWYRAKPTRLELELPGSGVILVVDRRGVDGWEYTLFDLTSPTQELHRAYYDQFSG